MFRPSPMDRVDILVLRSDLPEIGRGLAREGILHLRPVERTGLQRSATGDADPSTERLRTFAAKLDEILQSLDLAEEWGEEFPPLVDFHLWEEWAAGVGERTRRILDRKAEIDRRSQRLDQLEAFLRQLVGVEGKWSEVTTSRHTRLIAGTLPRAAEEKLAARRLPGTVFPLLRGVRETAMLVITSRSKAPTVRSILADLDFKPVQLPSHLNGSFETVLQKVRRARLGLSRYGTTLDARLAGLRAEHRKTLCERRQAVSAELALREAESAFGFTRRAVLLSGWLPRRRYRQARALFEEVCPGRYQLRRTRARGDETPVELINPSLLRPFEKVLALFGTPLYGEVEPTPLLAAGFLLLFGMMFGDVGQGLVLLGLGLGLRRFSRFREEGLLLAEVGGAASLFGVLFGSVFGLETLLPALWFSPFQNIPLLMGAALAVGIVLIFSGLLLRIANLWGQVRLLDLLTDRFGIAGAVFYGGSVGTVLLVWLDRIPGLFLLWLLLPLGATFFHPLVTREEADANLALLLAEGVIEVMETVLGYLVNTFSFLRVGAFGLAHIGLSYAVFALADLVRGLPLGIIWSALIYLLGNLLILALEGLVVSIQAIRLQFYEFFSKFFRGGGIPYRPLTLGFSAERRS